MPTAWGVLCNQKGFARKIPASLFYMSRKYLYMQRQHCVWRGDRSGAGVNFWPLLRGVQAHFLRCSVKTQLVFASKKAVLGHWGKRWVPDQTWVRFNSTPGAWCWWLSAALVLDLKGLVKSPPQARHSDDMVCCVVAFMYRSIHSVVCLVKGILPSHHILSLFCVINCWLHVLINAFFLAGTKGAYMRFPGDLPSQDWSDLHQQGGCFRAQS